MIGTIYATRNMAWLRLYKYTWALVGIAIALPIANRPLITEVVPAIRFSADGNATADPDLGSNGASSRLQETPRGSRS